jgi:hypothetical protein
VIHREDVRNERGRLREEAERKEREGRQAEERRQREAEERAAHGDKLRGDLKLAKFKHATTTAQSSQGRDLPLSGQAYHGLLVHTEKDWRGRTHYNLTHIASGKRIGSWDYRDGAKLAALQLARMTNWERPESALSGDMPRIRKAVERLRDDPWAKVA